MRKENANSLYCRLATPENRDCVFEWLYIEGASYREVAERIKERFHIEMDFGSVFRLAKNHGFKWRFEQAKERAEREAASLSKSFDKDRKRALAQREFVAVLEDLSFKEVLLAQRLELDREKLKLQKKLEPRKYELAKRKVDLLEGKLASAKEAATDPALSSEEKQQRMREIFGLA